MTMNATACLELALPATTSSVRVARRQVGAVAASAGAPDHLVQDVELCVNEAVANAVRHGDLGAGGRVAVAVSIERGELEVVVSDEGGGFDVDRPRGVGLSIMERLATRFAVRSGASGTEVRLAFRLETLPAERSVERGDRTD
jgi:anti-sigma regulatory factor (Ser/Thr protein kinase)